MKLTSNEISVFILSIAMMLLFARIFGEIFRKLKQPVVIGEIIAGIILGKTFLGYYFPEIYNYLFNSSVLVEITLQGFIELTIIMLMIVTGLEVDLSIVFSQSKKASLISLFSILFPFSFGFLTVYFLPELFGNIKGEQKILFGLFIGTALSVTALPIVVRLLIDLQIFKTEIGTIIITAAMFTDIFGWIFFSFILTYFNPTFHNNNVLTQLITILIFITFIIFIGRKIFSSIIHFLEKNTISKGAVISFIFIVGFLGAAFTQSIGIHAILGAFVIGIALGDSIHLNEETREIVQQFATNIFAPIFFVSIGLKINFIQNFDVVVFFVLLILSFIGKVSGSIVGSYFGKINTNDSMIIGFGMNSYGAMQIVLSLVAKQVGLIDDKIFVSLVILAIVTSLISAPLMKLFLKKSNYQQNFIDLLNKDLIFFSDYKNKDEAIENICYKISSYHKLDFELVLNKVLEREKQMSTGLVNFVAIPHARLKIKQPIVSLTILKNEIDYGSLDNRKTRIIILILTPEDKPEIQINLLKDIAKYFNTIEISAKIINIQESSKIITTLKEIKRINKL
ncbi:MAG: cation:proton antiporter [Melioribacteraceae bacterium]|nr:cation:proton antiporter [Melioribacteraceae bacterium]